MISNNENEFNIWLGINFDYVKEIQAKAKSSGYKTFGEIKNYIKNHFKNLGTLFEPSFLILSCDSFEEYRKLIEGVN